MITFEELSEAYEEGRKKYEQIKECVTYDDFRVYSQYCGYTDEHCPHDSLRNSIACGDNLAYMLYLIREKDMAGRIQLIYVDPPFFSNSKYDASLKLYSEELGRSASLKIKAYNDFWKKNLKHYLAMLTARLFMMRDLLSETGCFWIHLDWHAVHYVKLIMDNIFGEDRFVNEVVWEYKSGGANKHRFARKHDSILFYSRSRDYFFRPLREKSYNRGMKPYRFKGVQEFEDEKGWYTLVNMKDVWQVDMVGRTSSERSGYATQKPEKLIRRIVESCSSEGDLCADFFAGSGTFGAVCSDMGRDWIMCDESRLSVSYQIERMTDKGACFEVSSSSDPDEGEYRAVVRSDGTAVTLESYRPDYSRCDTFTHSDAKARGQIARYMENDSLSLVKIWSADLDYDGSVHRPVRVMKGTERVLETEQAPAGDISVRGYDVLGNPFHEVISRDREGDGRRNE